MKRIPGSLFLAACLAAFLGGCASAPSDPPDTVAIIDVQSTEIPDSEFTAYKLKVHYYLWSAKKGVVNIAFDLEQPGQYNVLGKQEVNQGDGEIEISADVRLPKRKTVTVYASLSEADHPSAWTPLARAFQELTIKE